MRTFLQAREEPTLELSGRLDVAAAVRGLPIEPTSTGLRVSLLLCRMNHLHVAGFSDRGVTYDEALWRVALRVEGATAWGVASCQLSNAWVAGSARVFLRYPVDDGRVAMQEPAGAAFHVEWGGGARLAVVVEESGEPCAAPPTRPVVTWQGGRWWGIPWAEVAPSTVSTVPVRVVDEGGSARALGSPVTWDTHAVLHRGRIHRCGVAWPTGGSVRGPE